ncbi:MAG: DegT/DnrJ/EryC1/StrS aminotransferase family protein [Pirellulales bacterium]|nr:DegT/DnrJ/EryC1/StrS aminotransferase family protein [Pirellulales bacterium]
MSTETSRSAEPAPALKVPFFRPSITEAEVEEVVACLRSGWLTTGPRTKQFETMFAEMVRGRHAIALNSCTAALHLAVEALHLQAGQGVLVPTMTFAATAEVVRYLGAVPVLVDCDPVTGNVDFADARRKVEQLRRGELPAALDRDLPIVGFMPVHVGGLMLDLPQMEAFAREQNIWVVEDAAHAFPAAWRNGPDAPWRWCGENTSHVACYSFYANKTITTGEGGMAVTDDDELAERMRIMSLHGLSKDAWGRYSGGGTWDYRIVAPGFKYNLTDVAAALGIQQLHRAESMRVRREELALQMIDALADVEELELPPVVANRIHAWHLFPIRLRLERLRINRHEMMEELRTRGVATSVHWRPLHLHTYYEQTFGWLPEQLPQATAAWQRLISLPLFPEMRPDEVEHVVRVVRDTLRAFRRGA